MIEEKDIKVGFPKEVWRTISNFPDYEISNIARVRNKKTGLIKVPSVGKRGYLVLNIKKESKTFLKALHRLFAETWIPNPESKREVNHINGDKCDCSFENLEWATPSENMAHARKTVLHNSDGDKAVWQLKDGKVIAVYKSCSQAFPDEVGIPQVFSLWVVQARGEGKLKTYKGYEWKYRFE